MFKGSLVALVTPMRADGSLDEAAFARFVEWQITEGTAGLVPVGTTGESPTLSHAEHKRVVEIAVEVAAGSVPVIAGAGSNSTAEAIELARHAKEAGADAALIVTPYYNKPDPGRDVPALHGDRRRGRPADHHLQHPAGASVVDMSVEDHGPAGEAPEHRRRERLRRRTWRARCTRRPPAGRNSASCPGRTIRALAFLAAGGVGLHQRPPPMSRHGSVRRVHEAWQDGRVDGRDWPRRRVCCRLHDAMFVETSPGPVKYAREPARPWHRSLPPADRPHRGRDRVTWSAKRWGRSGLLN